MPRTKTIPVADYAKYDLGRYPNFHKSGSITGMKKLYYGLSAYLVKCGNYIYNVPSNIWDKAN